MTAGGEPRNPFPGLRPFDPDEDHLFFGRETATDELLRRLRRNRLLAVVGSSGSGKSSLVRTGLIPSLHSGFMVQAGSTWRVAMLRPGEDPIGNLAAALDQPEVLRTQDELAGANRMMLEATLRRSPRGLADCVRYAGIGEHESVLVLVDQFEELFRFKSVSRRADARDEAVAFVTLLLEAARQQQAPVYVALTMRSDFIGDCMAFPGLPEAINQGQYLVPRMTRDELREAISGPVAVGGGAISRRLVMRLLNDVGDDPDQLPILQHALMRTWDHWMGARSAEEPIDLPHYLAVGGMRQALSRHAEEAWAELPGPAAQAIAEKLFKALTDGRRGVRRPVRLSEVAAVAGAAAADVRQVVEIFRRPGRSFLTPPAQRPLDGDPVIDLSHESLMRVWGRLIAWTREEEASAEAYLRLAEAARRHEAGTAGLWRDPELELGLQWREESAPTAAWAERYDPSFDRAIAFLDDSRRLRDAELAERERERRSKLRRARWLAAILGSAALVVFVFGIAAMRARRAAERSEQAAIAEQKRADTERRRAVAASQEAETQARRAESERDRAQQKEEEARRERRLAVAARQDAEEQRDRARRKEEEAERQRRLAEASRRDAEVQRDLARQKEEEARAERRLAVAARQEAVIERDRANRLWLLALARELAAKSRVVSDPGQREAIALLAVEVHQLYLDGGGEPEEPQIYDAARRALEGLTPPGAGELRHPAGVRAVAVSGPQGRLATAGDDGLVRVYDSFASGGPRFELAGDPLGSRSLALSADGRYVAAGGFDGLVQAWDLAEGAREVRLSGRHAGPVHGLAFRPGEPVLASAGADGVRLRDLRRPAEPAVEPAAAAGAAYDLAFDPGGEILAAAGDEGARVWRYARLDEAPARTCRALDLRSIALDPRGKTVACGDSVGAIELAELGPADAGAAAAPGLLVEHRSAVTDLAFSPAGDRLASASLDNRVMLWSLPLPAGRPLPTVLPHDFWVWAVAFGPAGERLYSAGADRAVRVWESRTRNLVRRICRRVERGLTVEEWEEYLAGYPRRDSCAPHRE